MIRTLYSVHSHMCCTTFGDYVPMRASAKARRGSTSEIRVRTRMKWMMLMELHWLSQMLRCFVTQQVKTYLHFCGVKGGGIQGHQMKYGKAFFA